MENEVEFDSQPNEILQLDEIPLAPENLYTGIFQNFSEYESEYCKDDLAFVFETEKRLKFLNDMKTKSVKEYINLHHGKRLNLVFYAIFHLFYTDGICSIVRLIEVYRSIYFQNQTESVNKAMCAAIYNVQIENGKSIHFMHGAISFLQILYAFDLITKKAALNCFFELSLHDEIVYHEILKCQPLTDKIKFQHTIKEYDSYTTLKLQINDLKEEIKHLKNVRDQTFDFTDSYLPSNLIFTEAQNKVNISPHKRKYSQTYYDICTASHILGSKSYEFLRNFFPLICDRQLRRHYSKSINEILNMLSDETRVNEIVEKTAIKGTTDDPIIATLAIDAAKFKNVKGSTILSKLPALAYHEINKIDKDAIYKDIFVFYIQPINKDIKPFPIHFELHTSGAAPDFIDDLIHFISSSLIKSNIKIEFVASDGDHHYDSIHFDFFDLYSDDLERGKKFSDIVDKIIAEIADHEFLVPISDFLHSIKLIRGNVVDDPVIIDINSSVSISKSDFLNYELGHAIFDSSKIGKMKDCYPLALFSNESVKKSLLQSQSDVLFFIIPFNCMIESLHNPHLSTDVRQYLLEFAFYFILHHLYSFKKNPRSILSKIGLIRMLNTIIGLSVALKRFDLVKLGHISSHPLENFFGMVRLSSHNNHSCENVLDSIAKGILLKNIIKKYGLSESIRSRVGLGGDTAVISKSDGRIPDSSAFQFFKDVWLSMKTGSIPEEFSTWYQSYRKCEWKDKFYTPSTVSGSNIYARYIADMLNNGDKETKEEKEKKEKVHFIPDPRNFELNSKEIKALETDNPGIFFTHIHGNLKNQSK